MDGLLCGAVVGTLAWFVYYKIEKHADEPVNLISSQYTKTGYQHAHIDVVVSVMAFTLAYAVIRACLSLYV